ncbi:type II CAAX endopeptidase family protein [Fodinicola feengrottensis]|uniref:CPBP family intramembrane glutamic endopeptidase n=1 Tax=Fodinicola feengrottensis TaxID=435914 RepID=UPI0031E1AA55
MSETILRRVVVTVGAAVFLLSLIMLPLTGHANVTGSSDAGAPTQPLWMVVLPLAVGAVLALLIPPRPRESHQLTGPRSVVLRRMGLLVGLAVLFPLVIGVGGLGHSGWYLILKMALLLLVPAVAFRFLRDKNQPAKLPRWFPRSRLPWLAPIPVIAGWALLTYVGPLAAPVPTIQQYPDPVYVAIAAVLTFLTASVAEEIFYRYLLQTHIEAIFGQWAGIIVSALLFALMHVPTHGGGGAPWVVVATAVSIQGVGGAFLGLLWARYCNIWASIAVHTMINGLPVVLYFFTLS